MVDEEIDYASVQGSLPRKGSLPLRIQRRLKR